MNGTTYDNGNISESILLQEYLKAGFIVSIPFGTGAPYDLVIDTGEGAYKVQVKTGWYQKGCIIFRGSRRVREASPYKARAYKDNEVDFLAVYYPPLNSIYVVPRSFCAGGFGCLRLEPVLNGQQKLIRWARDYTWEKHMADLQSELLSEVDRGPQA